MTPLGTTLAIANGMPTILQILHLVEIESQSLPSSSDPTGGIFFHVASNYKKRVRSDPSPIEPKFLGNATETANVARLADPPWAFPEAKDPKMLRTGFAPVERVWASAVHRGTFWPLVESHKAERRRRL